MDLPCRESYVLICEDVRPETHGKYSVLGVYGASIVVEEIPTQIPSIAFSATIVDPGVALEHVVITLLSPDGTPFMEPRIESIDIQRADEETPFRTHHIAFKLMTPKFELEGEYQYRMTFNEDPELGIEKRFKVRVGDLSTL